MAPLGRALSVNVPRTGLSERFSFALFSILFLVEIFAGFPLFMSSLLV